MYILMSSSISPIHYCCHCCGFFFQLHWRMSEKFLNFVPMLYRVSVQLSVWCFPWLDIHTRLMLLHDSRNDDGIKSFFQEVHELYIKVSHYLPSAPYLSFFFHFRTMFLMHVFWGLSLWNSWWGRFSCSILGECSYKFEQVETHWQWHWT